MDIFDEDLLAFWRTLNNRGVKYIMVGGIANMQFIPGWVNLRLNNGFVLDILISMKGLEGFGFDDCLRQANMADIEDVRIPFLHINHLIANKKAVNRPKDQLDVIYLEQINALEKDSSED